MPSELANCPHCGASLQGSPIPDRHNEPDATGKRPYGENAHYRREIGIEVTGVYDGVLYWRCRDCGGLWNRWPNTAYYKSLHDAAEREMKKAKK
jgi:hypothetical protein